jgi:hypothetical protein
MILLDNIIEVLALSNLNPFIIVLIILFDSRRVSATVIGVNQTWFFISTNRFRERTQSRFFIAFGLE